MTPVYRTKTIFTVTVTDFRNVDLRQVFATLATLRRALSTDEGAR